MLLSAEHLSKNYGMKTLLEDASIYPVSYTHLTLPTT